MDYSVSGLVTQNIGNAQLVSETSVGQELIEEHPFVLLQGFFVEILAGMLSGRV